MEKKNPMSEPLIWSCQVCRYHPHVENPLAETQRPQIRHLLKFMIIHWAIINTENE